jgi:RimJ/RimL family protein N-acetyltransferase
MPEILRFTYWPGQSREDTRAVIEQRRQMNRLTQEGDVLVLVAETRSTHRVIGDVDLAWTSVEHRQGEVGVMLHPEGQGKGYAQEAVAALLRLAFEDLHLHRVVGRTDARATGQRRPGKHADHRPVRRDRHHPPTTLSPVVRASRGHMGILGSGSGSESSFGLPRHPSRSMPPLPRPHPPRSTIKAYETR